MDFLIVGYSSIIESYWTSFFYIVSMFWYFYGSSCFLVISSYYFYCWLTLLHASHLRSSKYSSSREALTIDSILSVSWFVAELSIKSKNYYAFCLLAPQYGHSISVVIWPSKTCSMLREIVSIKNLPNSIQSCWFMFWNYGGDIFLMLLGLMAVLFDFKSKLKVLCSSARGLTVSLAINAKFLPSFVC